MSDGASVLVVDDNEAIADTYAQFLVDEYEVATAYSGEAALDALDSAVEVVLLDRRMPGLSGDEVLRRIDERALDCRVVMVTAVDPDLDILDLPFDEYVVKPVGREELVDLVAEMHRRAGYDDALRQFLALAARKSTLESSADDSELADNDSYARIVARIDEYSDDLGVETDRLEAVMRGDAPDIAGSEDPSSVGTD